MNTVVQNGEAVVIEQIDGECSLYNAADGQAGTFFGNAAGNKSISDVTVDASTNTITVPQGNYPAAGSTSMQNAAVSAIDITPDMGTGTYSVEVTVGTPGYIGAGTQTGTASQTFGVLPATTVTPGTANQTFGGTGYMMADALTVQGDADLIASNIRYDANIFGVQGTDKWNLIGDKWELVSTPYAKTTVALANTGFNTWTPSTTATSIVSAATAGTFSADMANYDYMLRWRFGIPMVYNTGVTPKGAVECEVAEIWQAIFRRPNSVSNIMSDNANSNACVTLQTAPLNIYWNTSGSETYTYSITYGIYPSATAATFSNATSSTPTVTIKTPQINARCNASYFATGMASSVDKTASKYSLVGYLYRSKRGAVMRSMYDSLIDIARNGV